MSKFELHPEYIRRTAEHLAGRAPDVVVGGFHLFRLDPEKESSGQLLRSIGRRAV